MQDTTGDGLESRSTPDQELSEWVSQNVNILVVGDESGCKARFISTFLGTGIDRDPSLENGFKKTVQFEDQSICVNINTNVGQESILGNCDACVRLTQAAIFVYNIYSRESFLLFGSWRDRLHREYEHMPIALVGCADRTGEDHTREVTTAEARKVAESCSGAFFEIGTTENKPVAPIMEVFSVLLQRVTTNKKPGFQKPVDDPDNTQQKYTELEIIVCGDVFVGKTQLIRQLLDMPYQSQYYATFDSEVHKHKAVIRDVGFILKVVDVGGLDLDNVLTKDVLMTAQGFVLVYGANSRDSFVALERIRKMIQQNKTDARSPIVLVANKTDLVRQVSQQEGQATAKRWGAAYFETCAHSATCHEDISECFEVLISDIQHIYAHVSLLDTIGEIDRQGYLGKVGNTFKTINRRYFSLKDCTLAYSNEIAQPIKDSLFLMENATTEVVNDPKIKEGFPFHVSAGEHRFALTASSEAERESWMASVRANLAIADIANSILDEVMRTMLWEACGKMPELMRRRPIPAHSSDDALLSTPPHKLSHSMPSTPTATSSPTLAPGLLGMDRMSSLGTLDADDFMVPIVGHDLSSSPSASPPISRSPAQLAKSISFLGRKHKK